MPNGQNGTAVPGTVTKTAPPAGPRYTVDKRDYMSHAYSKGDNVEFGDYAGIHPGIIEGIHLPTDGVTYDVTYDGKLKIVKSGDITGLIKTSGGKRKRQTKGQRRRRRTTRRR